MTPEERAAKNAYQREWAAKNADKVRESKRRWREKHKDRIAAERRAHRKANKEKLDAAKREWERKNPELVALQRVRGRLKRMNARRDTQLRRNYGVTLEAYNEILEIQGGVCAICRTHDPTERSDRLFVDHDHESGAVRALLCHRCNAGLGYFKDDVELMRKAMAYLVFFQSQSPEMEWVDCVRNLLSRLPETVHDRKAA